MTFLRLFAISTITAYLLAFAAPSLADTAEQKAVLVTGATSGIGLKIAQRLADNGYFVYAGARKQADMDRLNKMKNFQAVRLDVTKQDDIDTAVKTIRKGGRGLYAVVNNAGVAIGGPLTEVEESELHWLFDVNVYGVYRVTQAFAPMVIEEKGRIVNIGSISGILSGTFFGQYSMSKHAIEAYTDSLANELERFDVAVSVIEPGNYQSQIGASGAQRMLAQDYAREGSPYAEEIARFIGYLQDPETVKQFKEPDEVADAALHAISDANPKRRYMVVPNERQAQITLKKQLEELVQLNDWHAYSYSRDELVAMLDEVLAEQKK